MPGRGGGRRFLQREPTGQPALTFLTFLDGVVADTAKTLRLALLLTLPSAAAAAIATHFHMDHTRWIEAAGAMAVTLVSTKVAAKVAERRNLPADDQTESD